MFPNRALLESLSSDHQDELRADSRRRRAAATPTAIDSRNNARARAGWFLIGVGMRMVLGRGADTNLNVVRSR